MCSGPERSESSSTPSVSTVETTSNTKDMNNPTVQAEGYFSSLLDLAANNDVAGFKRSAEKDASLIDEVGLWYVRQKGSKQIVLEHRTPLMVAATYGSVDVLKFILSHSGVDVNFSCGQDKTTALHCATSGGSINAADVLKLLLLMGADPNRTDAYGLRPIDVLVVPPKMQSMRVVVEELLSNNASDSSFSEHHLRVSISSSCSDSPTLSSSPENGLPSSPSELVSSLMASKFNDIPVSYALEKKEYPVDPSLPDIKNSIYATDEFRMFSFKVRPCSRAYSHDWTECPFVHPGENARKETQGSTITAVCLALSSERGLVGVGICVNMLMEFLSVGSTRLNTGLGSARMVQAAIDGSVFLLTQLRSSVPCIYLPDLLSHHLAHLPLLIVSWTWLLQ